MLKFASEDEIANLWNGVIYDYTDGYYMIKNAGWNQDIEADSSVTFGYTAYYNGVASRPSEYEMLGIQQIVKEDRYEIEYVINSSWDAGYTVEVYMKNLSDEAIEDWQLAFDLDKDITNLWNAEMVSHEDGMYKFLHDHHNANIPVGGQVSFGFQVETENGEWAYPTSYELREISLGIEEETESEITTEEETTEEVSTEEEISTEDSTTEEPTTEEASTEETTTEEPTTEDISEEDTESEVTTEEGTTEEVSTEEEVDENSIDTDGDGMSDAFEKNWTNTDPEKEDSDEDGILDGDEDFDGDGLTNIMEYQYNGSPHNEDTDFDGLGDYEEYELGTALDNVDTDGDYMWDIHELQYGTDPLDEDTDGDKKIDGSEEYLVTQTALGSDGTNAVEPSVEMKISGSQISSLKIVKISENDRFFNKDMPGYIGNAYSFEMVGTFDSALMTFEYKVPEDTSNFEPCIYYFNEVEQSFEALKNQKIEDGKVMARVEHFSTYILLNRVEFEKIWEDVLEKPAGYSHLSLALVMDASASMQDSDPNKVRIEVAQKMIDQLGENDVVTITGFNDQAKLECPLTSDKEYAKLALSFIYSINNTAMYDGIQVATDELAMNSDYSSYRMMILLTDGKENCSNNTLNTVLSNAKKYGIVIHTIGLGNSINESQLEYIADYTGGRYFHAETANDLGEIFDNIAGEDIDYLTDTDEDGICDYYEDNLRRLVNGLEVVLDKNDPDVDGDGRLDGEEIYVYIDKYGRVYYKMISDPNCVDSDKDQIDDAEDEDPLTYTITDRTFALLAGLSYNNLRYYIGKTISEVAAIKGTLKNFDSWCVAELGDCVIYGAVDSGDNTFSNLEHFGMACVEVSFPQEGDSRRQVIAYRGSEFDNDSISFDVITDILLGFGLDSWQSQEAYRYYSVSTASGNYYYLAGHSLGGRLVQDVLYKAYKNYDERPRHSVTFNALGYNRAAYALLDDNILSRYSSSLTHYYYACDLVGAELGRSDLFVRPGNNICLKGRFVDGTPFCDETGIHSWHHGIVYLQFDYDLLYN